MWHCTGRRGRYDTFLYDLKKLEHMFNSASHWSYSDQRSSTWNRRKDRWHTHSNQTDHLNFLKLILFFLCLSSCYKLTWRLHLSTLISFVLYITMSWIVFILILGVKTQQDIFWLLVCNLLVYGVSKFRMRSLITSLTLKCLWGHKRPQAKFQMQVQFEGQKVA